MAVNSGSRGKIQERYYHGLMASSDSQRYTVTAEICSQIPRVMTSAESSADDRRASGTAPSEGRSHGRRITSART
ncbi:MAG TPA: hypothetical protein VHW04_10555 [Solirubrobacteraceae bacterium]|nr:hypothetical protein [Solirubrobacteraceae bacterium]